MNHKQLTSYLRDATEETSKINSNTVWIAKPDYLWLVKDDSSNLLGWVNAQVCCTTGKTTFSFRVNASTFAGVGEVESVTVDAPNLEDTAEKQKLVDFDQAIVDAFGL